MFSNFDHLTTDWRNDRTRWYTRHSDWLQLATRPKQEPYTSPIPGKDETSASLLGLPLAEIVPAFVCETRSIDNRVLPASLVFWMAMRVIACHARPRAPACCSAKVRFCTALLYIALLFFIFSFLWVSFLSFLIDRFSCLPTKLPVFCDLLVL